jgi:FKBP-type peptidyl-prolyl cis-trans isomerase FklB
MVDRRKSSPRILAAIAGVLLISGWALAQQPGGKQLENVPPPVGAAPELKTDKQKFSYGIGFNIGSDVRRKGAADELDVSAMLRGVADGITGNKLALAEKDLQEAMERFGKDLMQRQADRAKVVGAKNKKEGEAFLAANKSKEGVKTTASGLQYKVLVPGKGATPGPTDTVRVDYRGTLIDGTVFDSSGGEPVEFPVNRVIPGWTEALQLMKVGDKWQLFIPSGLAYKEHGSGKDIGPHAVLIFEVELKDVKKTSGAR